MFKYIMKRVLQSIPLIIIISILSFTLLKLAPYDPIDAIILPNMTESQIEALREKNHLNDPAIVQYLHWAKGVLKGDFGNAIIGGQSISESIKTRLPNTFKLMLPSLIISFILASILGLIAGANKDTWIDKLIDTLSSVGIAIPTFWFSLMIMYVMTKRYDFTIFNYHVNFSFGFPTFGMYTTGQPETFSDFLNHLVLPCTTLVIALTPSMVRYVRSSTIGQMSEDYVMVQSAYGSSKFTILIHHVLKNVLIPLATLFGMMFPMLVSGAVITESIFAWPGIGPYFVASTKNLDYPVIMSILLISSTFVIMGNLISDILYCLIDPRIKEMK